MTAIVDSSWLRPPNYDFIILDIGLPGMDGFQVAQEVRNAGIKTPVLMLTARDTTEMKVHGLDSGADDYLTKPLALPSYWPV